MLKKSILFILPLLALFSYWAPKENPIHIFLEVYATNPALLEMTEFVKLPDADPKIIAWHRLPNRAQQIDLTKYNTIEINVPAKEGYYQHSPQKIFIPQAMEELKKNPQTPIILYSNINQIRLYLIPFLQQIAPSRIKQIHIYEDGMCQIIGATYKKNAQYRYSDETTNQLKRLITERQGSFKDEFMTSLHKLYPVTYHFCNAEIILKDPRLKHFTQWIGQKKIQDVNIQTIADSLSKKQKNLFAQLVGLDLNKYQPLFKNKKTLIFTSGYLNGIADSFQVQVNILRKLKNGEINGFNPAEYQFFYKPHPAFKANDNSAQIQEEFPDIIPIPAQIPLEAFLITGLVPSNVSGVGSSLLFSLPAETIGFYIPKSAYTPILLRLKKITRKQFLDPADFFENEK